MRPLPGPLTHPWAISDEGMRLVLAIASRDEFFAEARKAALEARDGDPLDNEHRYKVVDGVAVIQIHGPLFRHASIFTDISGATSYDQIRSEFDHALVDGAVKAIALDVNSPGGDADGCCTLSDVIYAARGTKPIEAWVDGMCASAAFWIASAADAIYCSETSFLGSIGVRTARVDTSKAEKAAGIRTIEIISSQSPGKRDTPVDDEVLAKVQQHCDELAAVFIDRVARNFGISSDDVMEKFGKGDVLIAAKAIENGMAAGLGTLDQVITNLAAQKAPMFTGVSAMSKQMKPNAASLKAEDQKPDDAPDEKDKKSKKADGDDAGKKCDDDGDMADDDEAKADDGDGDADDEGKKADDDAKKKAYGEDAEEDAEGDDAQAKKALARMAGLSASASLGSIASALKAKTTSLTDKVALEEKLADRDARIAKLEEKNAKEAGEKFISTAIREGRTVEEKRSHLLAEYVKAESVKQGSGPAALAPQMFGKGTFTLGRVLTDGKGKPANKDDEAPANFAQDTPANITAAFARKAQQISAEKKVSYAKAMGMVKEADPDLYAAYAALRSTRR